MVIHQHQYEHHEVKANEWKKLKRMALMLTEECISLMRKSIVNLITSHYTKRKSNLR